jgi:hypothetical protein
MMWLRGRLRQLVKVVRSSGPTATDTILRRVAALGIVENTGARRHSLNPKLNVFE